MKKTFTILIAAIAAILMMAQPGKVMGQTYTQITQLDMTTKDYGCRAISSRDGCAVPMAKPLYI